MKVYMLRKQNFVGTNLEIYAFFTVYLSSFDTLYHTLLFLSHYIHPLLILNILYNP